MTLILSFSICDSAKVLYDLHVGIENASVAEQLDKKLSLATKTFSKDSIQHTNAKAIARKKTGPPRKLGSE